MYVIKKDVCEELLKSSVDGYPNPKVIEEYKNGERKVQKNTVRLLPFILKQMIGITLSKVNRRNCNIMQWYLIQLGYHFNDTKTIIHSTTLNIPFNPQRQGITVSQRIA